MKKLNLSLLSLFFAFSFLMVSCSDDDETVITYTVTVSSDGKGCVSINGTMEPTVTVVEGSSVTVMATANEGFEFFGWYGDGEEVAVSAELEYSFDARKDVELLAKFSKMCDAVDLGLSVKWASFNVGAASPEEYGGYYAWGETEEKEDYSWETYKWCDGTYDTLTKYCTDSEKGIVDNKTFLDSEDDVAHVKWGGKWRIPTETELKELMNDCTWEASTINGINGSIVTGPNGNSIFIPAAGYRDGANISHSFGWSFSILSNMLGDGNYDRFWGSCEGNYYLNVIVARSIDKYWDCQGRCYGRSVRAVCD